MSIYTVIIKASAQKRITKLPLVYQRKVKKVVLGLQDEPLPYGSKKLQGENNIYRIRIGVYRLLYSIEADVLTIFVFDVGHRKDIYR
jgi:mRNA interferase RelE/StbE